jgi:ribosomal protein S18 acetylase RimI-like enzyme
MDPAQTSRETLPQHWSTKRVDIRDATTDDVAALTDVFNACHYTEAWDPTFHLVETPEIKKLVKRSLSTSDEHIGFRLQALRLRKGGFLCGYFHIFHGMPQPDICWISIFVIHPDYQGQHLAREVVNEMAGRLHTAGYRAIWLEVFLRNWPALRFWIGAGFTTIIDFEGDKVMAEGNQARLILERPL